MTPHGLRPMFTQPPLKPIFDTARRASVSVRSHATPTAPALLLVLALAGCQVLPTAPAVPVRYDLGRYSPIPAQSAPSPLASQPSAAASHPAPAVLLLPLQAPAHTAGGTAMHYRLNYADAQVQHSYRDARWSQPPAQLVQQRLAQHLADQLGANGITLLAFVDIRAADAAGADGQPAAELQVVLQDFSQVYTGVTQSVGSVRWYATLVQPGPTGLRVLGQRGWTQEVSASETGAAAGAAALASAVDDAAAELAHWVQHTLQTSALSPVVPEASTAPSSWSRIDRPAPSR